MCLSDCQPDYIQLSEHDTSCDNLKIDQGLRVVIYSTQHGKIQMKQIKTTVTVPQQARQRRLEASQTIIFI